MKLEYFNELEIHIENYDVNGFIDTHKKYYNEEPTQEELNQFEKNCRSFEIYEEDSYYDDDYDDDY